MAPTIPLHANPPPPNTSPTLAFLEKRVQRWARHSLSRCHAHLGQGTPPTPHGSVSPLALTPACRGCWPAAQHSTCICNKRRLLWRESRRASREELPPGAWPTPTLLFLLVLCFFGGWRLSTQARSFSVQLPPPPPSPILRVSGTAPGLDHRVGGCKPCVLSIPPLPRCPTSEPGVTAGATTVACLLACRIPTAVSQSPDQLASLPYSLPICTYTSITTSHLHPHTAPLPQCTSTLAPPPQWSITTKPAHCLLACIPCCPMCTHVSVRMPPCLALTITHLVFGLRGLDVTLAPYPPYGDGDLAWQQLWLNTSGIPIDQKVPSSLTTAVDPEGPLLLPAPSPPSTSYTPHPPTTSIAPSLQPASSAGNVAGIAAGAAAAALLLCCALLLAACLIKRQAGGGGSPLVEGGVQCPPRLKLYKHDLCGAHNPDAVLVSDPGDRLTKSCASFPYPWRHYMTQGLSDTTVVPPARCCTY
ncbi:hypothetical protein HaLaN_03884 [Haematococcus lacustris]|uniref:Uncharacterized protein n=1 Tax=Haematococcus lacustris TaxID=44745 RepID=A0A699Z0H8_HAELA|nr:hypothetical protein HaLaN_03884 [Haematococcus lacustris]